MNDLVLTSLIRLARDGDMNAAHAVEGEIELRGMAEKYADEIETIVIERSVTNIIDDNGTEELDYGLLFKLIHSTAEQRAQAALRVLPNISMVRTPSEGSSGKLMVSSQTA